MNILCSTDENYVSYCGIMLTSLFENTKEEHVTVYIMTNRLSEKNKSLFHDLAIRYGNDIRLIVVDEEHVRNFPIKETDHVSLAAYYRIFAPLLLPQVVDKILYLDCDMIINKRVMRGGVKDLYHTDIEKFAIGTVVDENYTASDIYDRLLIPTNKLYFNSGMLLINLKYWREHSVMERCLKVIEERPESLRFHDQDTLNVVLQDEKKWLPISYNFQTGFLYSNSHYGQQMSDDIESCKYNPLIIHYTGPSKPWYKGSLHPYVARWMAAKADSMWKDVPLKKQKKTFYESFRELCVNIIWTLGIKKRPQTYIIPKQNE